jgi:hypothetical protein
LVASTGMRGDAEASRKIASLLAALARPPGDAAPPLLVYDDARQVSRVWEDGRWVDSWEARTLSGTKKFDIETGEDAKGR